MGSVLIVDDEEVVRSTFCALLEAEEHRVELAVSAAEGRERLNSRRFDVLITDLRLPQEDGLSLARFAARLDPQLSVVMVTGHPDLETAVEALKQGAYDYLTKPVSRQALVAAVERACERAELLREKQRLERENAEYQRSLERKVDERTRDLQESERRYRELFRETRRAYDELKLAQEKLIRSEKLAAIGELAASIAHEIRNPLGAISTAIGVLRRDLEVVGDDRRLLEVVSEEAQRLEGIVADFLKYARPRPPRKVSHTVHHLLDDLLFLLAQDRRTGGKTSIERFYDPKLPAVVLDPDQLREAVWNLLTNAVEAMPDGGRLKVEARLARRETGDSVEIVVTDSGKGIPLEEQVNVFQPFYTTKAEGTGLGLAIVQRIVEDHGGEIDLQSAPGHGSTFVMRLPLGDHQLVPTTIHAGKRST